MLSDKRSASSSSGPAPKVHRSRLDSWL